MLEPRRAERADTAGSAGTIDSWRTARNQWWAHTSLRHGWGTPTTAYTSGAVGSFITAPSYIPFTGDRWKRFLSSVSLMGTSPLRPHASVRFDGQEVIRRARSRIGEKCYRLLTNNCEHFCEWCLHGEPRSEQVERALALPRRLARIAGAAATVLLTIIRHCFSRDRTTECQTFAGRGACLKEMRHQS